MVNLPVYTHRSDTRVNKYDRGIVLDLRKPQSWKQTGQSEEEYFRGLPDYRKAFRSVDLVARQRTAYIETIASAWGQSGLDLVHQGVATTLDRLRKQVKYDGDGCYSTQMLQSFARLAERVNLETAGVIYQIQVLEVGEHLSAKTPRKKWLDLANVEVSCLLASAPVHSFNVKGLKGIDLLSDTSRLTIPLNDLRSRLNSLITLQTSNYHFRESSWRISSRKVDIERAQLRDSIASLNGFADFGRKQYPRPNKVGQVDLECILSLVGRFLFDTVQPAYAVNTKAAELRKSVKHDNQNLVDQLSK